MKIIKLTRYFFKQYTTFPDRVFMGLTLYGFIFGAVLISLNEIDFRFTTALLFMTHVGPINWLKAVCLLLFGSIFLFYGMYIRKELPRSSTFIWGLGLFFWCVFVNIICTNGLQATPFPPIDNTLVKFDQWMGINTPAIIAWTHNHPRIHNMLNFLYDTLTLELIFIPIILALCNAQKALGVFFIAELSSFFVGGAIYYFFPTMAPSGVFHSPYFSVAQHATSLRFYEVHHYLQLTTTDGGLIAFPSFHVIWAILLTNACRAKKIFFYPMVCLNIIIIASTVLLGWHYFADVIAGVVLTIGGVVFAEWVWKHSDVYNRTAEKGFARA